MSPRPIWTPLGYVDNRYGRRYWLRNWQGIERGYRASELYGITFLASVYPDLEHWRRAFPFGIGRKIDAARAASYFVREIEKAGEYVPGASAGAGAGDSVKRAG